MYHHFRSVPQKNQFQNVFSFFILIALVATLYAPGAPSLALGSTSPKNQEVNADLPSRDGALDAPVEQIGIVRSISPNDAAEEATPLQQAIMQSIEKRKASRLPVPSSASYEYEMMPSSSAAYLDEASDSPVQEFKLVYRTELQFDSPQQAGWEKWPDVVIEDTMPSNATGFVNEGDYTQSVREAAEQAQPGIWEQYEFGQEPRTFVYEETFEVFRTDESSSAPEVMSANPTSSGDILFGFTNSFVYDYKFVMSQEIASVGKIWAEAQVSYGWGAGIRLPINVSVTLDTEGKGEIIQGSNYWLKSSVIYSPRDWTAGDYENVGLPDKDIWNGKELVLDALYRVHVAAGSGETTYINKTYEGYYSLSQVGVDENGKPKLCEKLQDFVTPFGDFYYPPGDVEDTDCPFPGNKTGGINIFDFDPLFYIPLGDIPYIASVSLGFGFIVNAGLGSKSITAQWVADGTASGKGDINYPAYNKEIIFGPVTAEAANQPISIRLNKWIYHPSLLLRLLAYPCLKAVFFWGDEQTKCMRNLQLKIYEEEILEGADLSVHKGTPDSIVLEKIPVSSSILIEMISDKSAVPVGDMVTITTTIKNVGSTKLTNVRISESTVEVAVIPELNPGDKFSLEPHTFTATVDHDITNTIAVSAILTSDNKPVPITSTASIFIPVLNGVVGSGTQESCTEGALDAELGDYTSSKIIFNCGGPATIVISETKTISGDITIDGNVSPGGRITISGNHENRVFKVNAGGTLNLQNLVVADGSAHRPDPEAGMKPGPLEPGGGIFNLGTVNLHNVSLIGNEADQGGGIHNSGTLNIAQSELSGNTAKLDVSGDGSTWDGGAIYNDGSLTITGSTIENNTANGGGGLLNWGGTEVDIADSVIAGNQAANGGGIENGGSGEILIRDSRIRNNQAHIGGESSTMKPARW